MRLARVRASSLLGRLGIQDGDVLTRIDGLEMTSPDRWLEEGDTVRMELDGLGSVEAKFT